MMFDSWFELPMLGQRRQHSLNATVEIAGVQVEYLERSQFSSAPNVSIQGISNAGLENAGMLAEVQRSLKNSLPSSWYVGAGLLDRLTMVA